MTLEKVTAELSPQYRGGVFKFCLPRCPGADPLSSASYEQGEVETFSLLTSGDL